MDQLHQEISEAVRSNRRAISERVIERQYAVNPAYWESFGQVGREKRLPDVEYHLAYLIESIAAADPNLFGDYLAWAKVLFKGLNLPDKALEGNIGHLRDVLRELLDPKMRPILVELIETALRQLIISPDALPSFIHEDSPLFELARNYLEALLEGKRNLAGNLILDAANTGVAVKDIYSRVFQPCQYELGRLWQMNRLSVAQEHYCTAATQLIMSQLYPYIFATERIGRRLVATCVGSELNEIRVRRVADFFGKEGWDTYYLGADVPPDSVRSYV
ncbi:MAG: B12-binding domain-containing protein [Deltaproteobacteria bacterium]|nr:B12-binding domain-containing protein [Deltaproteobacteria bacterium]